MRFYSKAQGDDQKTLATRGAHRTIEVTVNGWDIGVTVAAWKCSKCGGDRFNIRRNGGSNDTRSTAFITEFCGGCHEHQMKAERALADTETTDVNAFGE
jgi:hypothetical protein